jgi:hypothetical protein
MSLSYYYRKGEGNLFCVQQILFPPFRYSGPVDNFSGPVDSWCSLVLDQCTFGKMFNPCCGYLVKSPQHFLNIKLLLLLLLLLVLAKLESAG